MYGGQAMVHTSGVLGPEVLAPAMAAGTQIGAFHPLVAFADTERAVAALHGATVAIEGDDQLAALLAEMAEAIGAVPGPARAGRQGRLPRGRGPGRRRLRRAARRDRGAGPGRRSRRGRARWRSTGRSSSRRSATPGRSGSGPRSPGRSTRGDRGTLDAHLAALRDHAPGVLDLYVAAAEREIALAEARGALTPEAAGNLRSSLATAV